VLGGGYRFVCHEDDDQSRHRASGTSAGRQRGLKKKSMRRPGFACGRMIPRPSGTAEFFHTLGLARAFPPAREPLALSGAGLPPGWSTSRSPACASSGRAPSAAVHHLWKQFFELFAVQHNAHPDIASQCPTGSVSFSNSAIRHSSFGLSGSLVLEDVSQLHSGLVQLRLAVAD